MKAIEQRLSNWLNVRADEGTWLMAYVSTREQGLDVVRSVAKLFRGEHSATTVEYDTLPASVVNISSGVQVFVVSQPDHIDTVIATMEGRTMTHWKLTLQGLDKTDFFAQAPSDKELEKAYLRGGIDERSVNYVRKPVEIIVDVDYPVWDKIIPLVGRHTEVLQTDNVKNTVQEVMKEKRKTQTLVRRIMS